MSSLLDPVSAETSPPAWAALTGVVTGARLIELIEVAAAERGVTARKLASALSPYPDRWLTQLAIAKRPKPMTIERIRALLFGEPIPDAPPNNFQARVDQLRADASAEAADREERFTAARRTAGKRPVLPIQRDTRGYHSAGERQPDTWPEPIERDPCFRCGVRADVGCRHRPSAHTIHGPDQPAMAAFAPKNRVNHLRSFGSMSDSDNIIEDGPTPDTNIAGLSLTKETASEFDFMVLLDASGSMGMASKRFPGKNRWEEAQESIFGIAAALGKLDDDGIDIVVFGGDVKVHEGVTADQVQAIFASRDPSGGTPTTEALQVVIDKQRRTGKNTVAFVFTDGEPNDKPSTTKAIVDAANALDRDESLTFCFVQIGDAADATAFLQHLDDDLQPAGAKFDIVDTIPVAQAETMTAIDLINKAIND